jgi:spore coat polysaccharide biosynthesis protein SpsF
MRRVAIIQARMTSTRLPGKVLSLVAGRPMLAQQLERLRGCRQVDELLVATTTNSADDPVAALARKEGVGCFRGEEHDVLGRYLGAARWAGADVVIRITADCPLIDSAVADRVVETLLNEGAPCDYASNTLHRSYPRGLDVEVFWMDVLQRMARLATSSTAREHVTWFLHRERPDLFLLHDVIDSVDNSDLRWTVDEPEDLELVRRLFVRAHLPDRQISYQELVDLVRSDPELLAVNARVAQRDP